MIGNRYRYGIAAAFAVVLAGSAFGQAIPNEAELGVADQPAKSGWHLNLGAGFAVVSTYPGAKDNKVRFVPMISLDYGDRLSVTPHGLRWTALNLGHFRAGPLLSLDYGRRESRDPALTGLGNIPISLMLGGFASYSIGPIEAVGEVREAVTHTGNGLTGRVALKYRRWIIPDTLGAQIGPVFDFADNAHTQTWFGITPDQSLASGLPVYTPHGGLTDVGLEAGINWLPTQHVLLRSYVNFRDLVGDSASSPIVQSKTETVFGLGVAYRF